MVDALSGPSSGPSPSQGSSLSSASRGWQPPSIDHNQSPQRLRNPGNPISQQPPQQQQSQPHSCYNLASSALESLRLETRYDCSKKRALDGPQPISATHPEPRPHPRSQQVSAGHIVTNHGLQVLGAACATRLPPCLNLLKGHLVPVGGAHHPLRR